MYAIGVESEAQLLVPVFLFLGEEDESAAAFSTLAIFVVIMCYWDRARDLFCDSRRDSRSLYNAHVTLWSRHIAAKHLLKSSFNTIGIETGSPMEMNVCVISIGIIARKSRAFPIPWMANIR